MSIRDTASLRGENGRLIFGKQAKRHREVEWFRHYRVRKGVSLREEAEVEGRGKLGMLGEEGRAGDGGGRWIYKR